MTAETRSSRTIFLDALNRVEPEARQEFINSACGNDASLRAEVQRLLDAHGNLNGFMEQPAAAPTEAFIPIEYAQIGAMVGRYKLLEQIGEGGMGVVYLAEQTEPVRRRVALKIIKPGIDTKQVIARFEAERQALAMMDHPNIAKVLDAGATGDGRPYFVMELVRGLPITEYCDQGHIDTRSRLELFATICQAVQHAHQKGIIHRDIKPSNVLVTLHDGQAVGKVIDFGIAKAINQPLTERTIYTAFSEIVGTPLYMSPEQATLGGLDIDTRSDVYSLGVLLYELLTGQTPFDRDTLVKAGLDEVRRIIREDEPPTPSHRISSLNAETASAVSRQRGVDQRQLHRVLQNELDWIVMKSLAKERERRYETASSFAKDIERFLNHEPVQAGPPSVRYRLRKFARRNRPQVIAASLVLAALLTGTVGTTLGLVWAIKAEGVAEQRFEETEAARKKAEQAEDNTLEAYRESTDDAIEQLIGSKPELGPQEQAYLNKTLERWQAFANRQGADERSRAIRGEGHYRVATLWQKLGKDAEALRQYQAARDIEMNLVEQFPNVPKYRQSLATTRCSLGLQWRTVGNSREALVECRAAHKLQKELVEKFPSEPEYQSDLATTHNNLGMLLAERGDSDGAQVEWQAGRSIQKQLVQKFPATLAYQHDLALSHKNLGTTLAFLGNEEAARVEYQAARDILQKVAQGMPTAPMYQHDLASAQVSLGNQLARVGKPEAAQSEYEAARTIQKALVEQFPAVPAYHQNLANTHNNLGALLAGLGKREAAKVEYEAARDLGKLLVQRFRGVPEHELYLGTARVNLALLLAEMGNSADAQAEHLAARAVGEKLVEQFPAVPAYQKYLADVHNNLGIFFKAQGNTEKALAEHRMSCDLSQKLADRFPAVPQYRLDLSVYYRAYATLVCDAGNPKESLKWFEQAVRTVKPLHELAPGDAATREILRDSHWGRALAYEQLKQPTQAIEDWNQTIELSPTVERLNFEAIRATSMLHAGMVAEAMAQVAELSNDPRWRAEQWYGFACIAAVASGKIADNQQEYADGAMNLLQLAVQAGFKDAKHLAHDTELAALRDREDFKKLVAELEKQ